tara:strand:- start:282 stop:530 length:249 start_codon:yes stop_codon:yes gene_type:complete
MIIIIILIICMVIGMYFASQIGSKIDANIERNKMNKRMKKLDELCLKSCKTYPEEEETIYSCCGDDMTGKDIQICPTCKEHQ